MNTKLKISLSIVAVLVIGAVAGWFSHRVNYKAGAVSPAGTYQFSDVQPQVTFNGAATTTWATFFNAGPDKVVYGVIYYVPTLGSSVTLQAATSTDPVDLNSNTNYVFNATVASTTPYLASSTPVTNSAFRVWPAGTYLNFVSSATSTGGGIITVQVLNE
jgi:hypothetical protein